LAVFVLFWVTDVVFQIDLIRINPPLVLRVLHDGDIVLVLVTVIGGRIVPSSTSSALRPLGLASAVQNRPMQTSTWSLENVYEIDIDLMRLQNLGEAGM
jgi:uncharacterized protein involved in response to NO